MAWQIPIVTWVLAMASSEEEPPNFDEMLKIWDKPVLTALQLKELQAANWEVLFPGYISRLYWVINGEQDDLKHMVPSAPSLEHALLDMLAEIRPANFVDSDAGKEGGVAFYTSQMIQDDEEYYFELQVSRLDGEPMTQEEIERAEIILGVWW